MVTLSAPPDKAPTYACTQQEHPAVEITLPQSKILNVKLAQSVHERLVEWDPFWETLSIVGMGVTSKIVNSRPDTRLIRTAAVYNLTLPQDDLNKLKWGERRGDVELTNGEVALILRMLPCDDHAYKQKRADCHLWPKGTLLQINGEKILLAQRKQQAHSHSEWKNMCRELDLTEYIRNPKQANNFQFFCYDDQPHFFVFSFCRFISVQHLKLSCEKTISLRSQEGCFEKAMSFVSHKQTVTLDSDDDGGLENEANRKLVYSLLCPISKTIMKTPVRGKNCKHFQVSSQVLTS